MIRRIGIALVAVLLGARAGAAELPSGAAVWRGTLGDQAIVACLAAGGGSYYYEARKWNIPLAPNGVTAGFREGDSAESTGSWRLQKLDAAVLTAEWISPDGSKRLPIRLARTKLLPPGADSCDLSAEYNAPRLAAVDLEAANTVDEQGIAVQHRKVRGLEVDRLQLELPGAGAAAINARLDAEFRRHLAMVYSCVTGNRPGDFASGQEVEFASARWIVVGSSIEYYCGGAHPELSLDYFSFDRGTGRQIDTSGWLRSNGDREAPAGLWPLLARKASPEGACREVWLQGIDLPRVRPSAGGVTLEPAFPHAVRACEDSVELGLEEARPFLTDAAMRELEARR